MKIENRTEIQKAQKALKPKSKTSKNQFCLGTMVAAETVDFLVFLGKSWTLEPRHSNIKLFPRKKLFFAMHGLEIFQPSKLFPGKSWFLEPKPAKIHFFTRKKLVSLEKTNLFLGELKIKFFSSHHSSNKSWIFSFLDLPSFVSPSGKHMILIEYF